MTVAQNPTVRATESQKAVSPSALITAPECPTAVVEAYHTLLTNVDLAMGPHAGGMLAIAAIDDSADAHGVAANLALVAAQGGERTLLVDCDVHNPLLDQIFALDAAPGLAQLLGGEHTELRTLTQPTALPTLGVIAAGANSSRHNRLARLGDIPATLLRLKNAADRVILVAPPVLSSTDVLRLSPYVDGVLLIVTPGRTQRQVAARAREIMAKAEAPLLGVTLAPPARAYVKGLRQ